MRKSQIKLNRRDFILAAGAAGLGSVLLPSRLVAAADKDAPQRPNLLFIIADQHRGDFMGCAGHPLAKTPSLDQLATQGTRFERAYTSWPICVPARMSIITGRYPHSHGAYGDQAALTQPTIADHLKSLGCQTGAIGKMHFLDADQRHGFDYRVEHEDFDNAIGEKRRAHTVSSRDGKEYGVATWTEDQTYEHFIADKSIAWLEKNRQAEATARISGKQSCNLHAARRYNTIAERQLIHADAYGHSHKERLKSIRSDQWKNSVIQRLSLAILAATVLAATVAAAIAQTSSTKQSAKQSGPVPSPEGLEAAQQYSENTWAAASRSRDEFRKLKKSREVDSNSDAPVSDYLLCDLGPVSPRRIADFCRQFSLVPQFADLIAFVLI